LGDFSKYLRQVEKQFGTQRALAEAIGITPQRLSRALAEGDGYTLNTENCLRLAKIANRAPGEVLRAAGKEDIADLLEFLFPKAGRPTITGHQRELLDDWELLNDGEQRAFKLLIHERAAQRRRELG
jgi:transcriptional regulator with XRE-family HTH domain